MTDDSQIVLFANFDSGNMARYERVLKPANQVPQVPQATQNQNQNLVDNKQPEPENQTPVQPIQQKFDIEFNVWTKPDCDGTPVGPNPNKTWFYFGVRGGHGKFIKFNLMNLNRQSRLFEMGMLPVFKTIPGHEKWSRVYIKPTWQTIDNQFYMSFIHRFPDRKDSITYFAFCFPHSYDECQSMLEGYDKKFAYCKSLSPDNCDPDAIYYHREVLCYSLDKRRIDLLTISSCNDLTYKREPRFDPENLFPKSNSNQNPRCLTFDHKKVYVLTSRVHPGETPASFVFNGFLDFILRKDDPRAKILRRNFVFKLIPMLNPDGVSRGHYRTDQWGVNLNRVYTDPDFDRHPSIYAVKSLIVYHHVTNRSSKEHDGLNFDDLFKIDDEEKKEQSNKLSSSSASLNSDFIFPTKFNRSRSFVLPDDPKNEVISLTKSLDIGIGNENSDEDDFGLDYSKPNPKAAHLNDPRLSLINPVWSGIAFYVDLHGHAAKRGCFIYGNSIENELYQIENVLFAKLIAFNTQHFDFDGCNFSVKNMFMKDKREGLSKEGSGRVAMHKILGIIHSYTLECSYAAGRTMNTIPAASNWNPRMGTISPPLHIDLPPKFQMEHYADVGKALAIAALDISETNPFSRIVNSSFGSLEAVRNWVKFYIRSKNGGGLNTNNSQNASISFKKNIGKPKNVLENKNTKPPVKLVHINKPPVAKFTRSSTLKLSQTEKTHRHSLAGEIVVEEKMQLKKNYSLNNTGNKNTNYESVNQENADSRLGHRKLLPINKAKIGSTNSFVFFNKINANSQTPKLKAKNVIFSFGNIKNSDSKMSIGNRDLKSETFGLDAEDDEYDDYSKPNFYLQNEELSLKEKNDLIDKLDKIDFIEPNMDALNFDPKNDLDTFEQVTISSIPMTQSSNNNQIENNSNIQKSQSINLILNNFNKKIIRFKRK